MKADAVPNQSMPAAPEAADVAASGQSAWYAIWTRSRSEPRVADELSARGFDIFNPTVLTWATRHGVRRRRLQPLFPGYVFVHHAMDRNAHVEILKARGVIRLLGERWDRLSPIPSDELDAVRRVVDAGLPARPHEFVTGDRVRIVAGPLAGLTGVYLRARASRGLLLVSITLLRRSVAVEVDGALVEAA